MRIPQKPPGYRELWRNFEIERRETVFDAVSAQTPAGRYLHWDKLRHLKPPGDLSSEEWWFALKTQRRTQRRPIPLMDVNGAPFSYGLVDPIPEGLHYVDQGAAGSIAMPDLITNPDTKDRYLVGSLIEEAITSSQLEGAATTRLVAKEMIRTGRTPRDRSERMILNNFRTMQQIGKLKRERLSKELVRKLHGLVTRDTLDDPSAEGRLRRPGEEVVVDDMYGQVFHEPPPGEQLEERMEAMCDFANGKSTREFIHPVIRSMILHFWLAYDHPFIDGNGRTARALFYWSMLHYRYWMCEFISISEIIRKAPAKYGRAFLYTETDDNDLTYFLVYHLDVIRRAVDELHKYVARKTKQLEALESELRGMVVLNHRQRALISHALRHPHHRYTIESHRVSHNVAYQTARIDLLDLAGRGVLEAGKVGREWHFTPVPNLERRLAEVS